MPKRFDISSVGTYQKISVEMFADKIMDKEGNEVNLDDLDLNETAYVEFTSGTGVTRTSVVRIE